MSESGQVSIEDAVYFLLPFFIFYYLIVDVSGGYSTSLLDGIRLACITSNMVGLNKQAGYNYIDYKDAFRLATLGGSQGCDTYLPLKLNPKERFSKVNSLQFWDWKKKRETLKLARNLMHW